MKKIYQIILITVLFLGLTVIPAVAATDYSFNYTITATGTEDIVTDYPNQSFNWTFTYTDPFLTEPGQCWICTTWPGGQVTCGWVPCTVPVTYTISGLGVVNATEGNKLIATTPLTLKGDPMSVSCDNPNVTMSYNLSCVFCSNANIEIRASTSYGETASIPWSATESGSATVNDAEGDKFITTSTLVAPNGDTTWSVTDDNPDVHTWMVGNQLYASVSSPVLSSLAANDIEESGTSTVSGSISDPDILDTFTLEVDWGDGTPAETFNYPAGTTSFSEAHQYLDDDPSGTSSDPYTISVTLTDDDGGSDTAATQITVQNVTPTLSSLEAPSVDEGGTSALSGKISDPGTLDTFMLEVDWGDGSPIESFVYPAGTTGFAETHQYLDDDPSSTVSDPYTISVTLTDDDLGSDTATTQVTVQNVAPTLSSVSATDADEGSTSTLSGSIADPGTLDTFTLKADWGDGTPVEEFNYPAGTTTFSETHSYGDQGNYTVKMEVEDDDGGLSEAETYTVTISNIAPLAEAGSDQMADEGEIVTFAGSFTDPGWLDTHSIEWDYGDGETDSGSLNPEHSYGDNGIFTVTLTVTDDDGGVGSDTLTINVENMAPTVEAGPDQTVYVGSEVQFNGNFTDPGWLDTHTIEWSFGDGNTTTGTLTPVHNYSASGEYVVTLTVTDDDGGVGQDTVTVNAIKIHAYIDLDSDTLNLKAKGKSVTCFIELQDGFNVEDINTNTILLNGEIPAATKPITIGDYDSDGIPDLMVKFDRTDLTALLGPGGAVSLMVTGDLDGGLMFDGNNTIKVINPGK